MSGATLAVRPAVPGDAGRVAALVNSAYRGDSSRAGWTTEADLLGGQRVDQHAVAAAVSQAGSVILLHDAANGLVSCVHLQRTGDECYLGMLTVAPHRQAQGLGRRMLHAAERWAVRTWGSQAVHLTVISQRAELIAWYERRGYRRTGTQQPFPYGDVRFGMPLRSDLVFEVLRKRLAQADVGPGSQ